MRPTSSIYKSYDVDASRKAYISYNNEYFKSVFFDIAPILAVPAYHDGAPVASDETSFSANYTQYEHEVLANAIGAAKLSHPSASTDSILKTKFLSKDGITDRVEVTSYSYRAESRTDYVTRLGADGRYHNVPVHWMEYIPVTATHHISLVAQDKPSGDAYVHGICATLLD
jgi:hypothetical protein